MTRRVTTVGEVNGTAARVRRGPVLTIILAGYLLILIDVSILMAALPRIHEDLGFSATGLSWAQNAYTLAFGGLLLLGARAGDLLGRRRMFVVGIALFAAASLAVGLAQSPPWMIAARVVHSADAGWTDPVAVAALVAGVLLVALFVTNQKDAAQPLMPLRLFGSRERAGAYTARFLFNGTLLSFYFFMTQYLQGVSGFSPLKAGLAFLPVTAAAFAAGIAIPRLTERVSNAGLAVAGCAAMLVGTFWLSRVSVDTVAAGFLVLALVVTLIAHPRRRTTARETLPVEAASA